jgi:hypothetical protein
VGQIVDIIARLVQTPQNKISKYEGGAIAGSRQRPTSRRSLVNLPHIIRYSPTTARDLIFAVGAAGHHS